MESKLSSIQTATKCKSLKAFKVMKTLSSLVEEEVRQTSTFKVTYIANKKAKIVKTRVLSETSTDDE